MNSGDFYSLIFRMKHIDRWGLMRNTTKENLSEHSLEVAVLAHALALIGNKKFNMEYDANRIAVAALFHDMNEILTGDLPTPVKYYNEAIKTAYKEIEKNSCEKMLSLLDEDLKGEYQKLLTVSKQEEKLIKAADRLAAYIKCRDEQRHSNPDFDSAARSIKLALDKSDCPELKFFIDNCLEAFDKTLDQITL